MDNKPEPTPDTIAAGLRRHLEREAARQGFHLVLTDVPESPVPLIEVTSFSAIRAAKIADEVKKDG